MTTRDETARGDIADLARDFEAFRHETRKQLNFLELAVGNHASKLGDVKSMMGVLIDRTAEMQRMIQLLVDRSGGAGE